MPKTGAMLLTAIFAVLLVAPRAHAQAGCAHTSAAAGSLTRAAAARAIRCLVNAERRARGLAPVHAERRLRRAAARHARDMAVHDFFEHTSPRTGSFESRVRRAGYLRGARSWSLGEALAWGQSDAGAPRHLVDDLLASPPHRAILLDRSYSDVGIGVALGAPDRPGGPPSLTVALDFGRRT